MYLNFLAIPATIEAKTPVLVHLHSKDEFGTKRIKKIKNIKYFHVEHAIK